MTARLRARRPPDAAPARAEAEALAERAPPDERERVEGAMGREC